METDLWPLNINALTSRWWTLVVRGVAAIAFGVLTLLSPSTSVYVLIALWGAYAIVDGIFNMVLSARTGRAGGRWGWLLFEGVVSVLAGVLTFVWPGITALALFIVIAAWAVITGIAEIAAAIELRKVISGEWLLVVTGILSIAFGVLLLAYPAIGAVAVVGIIAVYAMVFGLLLIGLGLRVRAFGKRWAAGEAQAGVAASSRRARPTDGERAPPP